MSRKSPAPQNPPPPRAPRLEVFWFGVLAAGLCFLVYLPAIHGGFLWDDDAHVTKLELQSWHGLWRIWSEVGATQQYYPVLHSFFWLEHRLWGETTLGYHLTNLLLHAAAAGLLVAILRKLAIPGAWLAGLIFVLHPVAVESVAWISEQKNTLSTVFYLLAALAFLRFEAGRVSPETGGGPRWSALPPKRFPDSPAGQAREEQRSPRGKWWWIATAFFVLALLSKTVTATLPAALLVVVWWKRGRLSWKRDFFPLLPWLGIGAGAGLFSAWVERAYIGAQGASFALDGLQRCLLAGRTVWFYLGKLFWPARLIFIYPHWSINAGDPGAYLYPLAAIVVLAGLWILRRRSRGPLAGALFFVGSLFPALGFFNVYPFLFSYVADHFQYLASLGVIVPAAAGLSLALERSSRAVRRTGWCLVACGLAALGGLSWRQSRIYRDAETLYQTTIQLNPNCWLFYNNLGVLRADAGRTEEAVACYDQALQLKPDYAVAYYNLGNVELKTGRLPPAISNYEKAVQINPLYVDALLNLGVALANSGRLPEAIAREGEALRLQPRRPEAHNDLGVALMGSGRNSEAIAQYEEALRLKPDYAEAHNDLGYVLEMGGRLPAAAEHFEAALRLRPDFAEAHGNLANVLRAQGRTEEAIAHYRAAIAAKPDYMDARNNLGVTLIAAGRAGEAVDEFEQALQRQPNQADIHRNLGIALRATGKNDAADAEFKMADELQGPRARKGQPQ